MTSPISRYKKFAAIVQTWLAGSLTLLFLGASIFALLALGRLAIVVLPFYLGLGVLFFLFFYSAFREVLLIVKEEASRSKHTTKLIIISMYVVTLATVFFWAYHGFSFR